MTLRGKGINLQVLTECICYLMFGCLLFHLTYSGRYLNYVTPRMKPYLYGMSALMFIWAVSNGRYLLTPQYRAKLTRSFVFIIPILLLAARPSAPGGSSMVERYDSSAMPVASGDNGGQMTGDSGQQPEPEAGEEEEQYDLKGLDEAAKTITIADEDYYMWMYELSSFYEKYEGYTVIMKGFVYRDPDIQKKCDFALVRLSMWCCAADLSPMGFLVDSGKAQDFKDDDWVAVKGVFGISGDGESLILKAQSVEAAEKPEEEYVYPY